MAKDILDLVGIPTYIPRYRAVSGDSTFAGTILTCTCMHSVRETQANWRNESAYAGALCALNLVTDVFVTIA